MMRTRVGSLIAVAAIVVAACSGSATPTPAAPSAAASAAPSAAAASPASTATEGGNMVYALDGDMAFADPSLVSDGNSLFVEAQVVQGLLGLQPGTISTVIPVLAASLPTVSADGLS